MKWLPGQTNLFPVKHLNLGIHSSVSSKLNKSKKQHEGKKKLRHFMRLFRAYYFISSTGSFFSSDNYYENVQNLWDANAVWHLQTKRVLQQSNFERQMSISLFHSNFLSIFNFICVSVTKSETVV